MSFGEGTRSAIPSYTDGNGSNGMTMADKRKGPGKKRHEAELPLASAGWGWRYHHLGIPTGEVRPGERYLEEHGMHVSGFDTSPFGIEWMRFEPDSPVADVIKNLPHIAFEVDDLEGSLEGMDVISEPSSPTEGVKVAMILHDGLPVELMEFDREMYPADGKSGQ